MVTTSELSGEKLSQGDSCVICSVLSDFLMCAVTSGLKHRDLNPTSHCLPQYQRGQETSPMQRGTQTSTTAPTLSPALSAATAACDWCPWNLSPGSTQTWALFATALPCAQVRGSDPVWEAPSHLSLRRALSCQNNSIALHWEGREGIVCECSTMSHHPSL